MSRSAFRGWMLAGLVPAMFALDLALPSASGVPTGVAEALGCAGGGSAPMQESWTWLKPRLLTRAEGAPIPVATDGFFVIDAEGYGISLEEAQAQLRVVVRDAGGTEVPGDLSVLRSKREGWHLFGWAARAPLELGARLSAVLATEPASTVGGQFVLEVQGAPTPLPAPELAFQQWIKFYHGTGDSVPCTPRGACGGPSRIFVSSSLVEQLSTTVRWTPPELVGGVAWDVRVEITAEQAQAEGLVAPLEFFGEAAAKDGVYLEGIVFPHNADQYCVTLVLEDLRTGQARRAEACSEAGPLERSGTDTQLAVCTDPPSPALTRAWCELTGALNAERCAAVLTPETSPLAEVTVVRSDLGADSTPSSSGCQLGAARSTAPAVAALTGLVLAGLRRARARRRSS